MNKHIKTNSVTALKKKVKYVGLDVHKETIAVAIAEEGREGKVWFYKTISHDLHGVEKLVAELREGRKYELKVCYEAGPTGFVLARRLNPAGD